MFVVLIFIILLFISTYVLLLAEFTSYVILGQSNVNLGLFRIAEMIHIMVYPGIFLIMDQEAGMFHNTSRVAFYALIILCILSYCSLSWRSAPAPPFFELVVNCMLLIGIAANISFYFYETLLQLAWIFNTPVILLFILMLIKNHKLVMEQSAEENNTLRWGILVVHPLWKFFVLVILCVPVLLFISCTLMAFGQPPDALILAFIKH